ncbi:hepatocyte growth factor-regulated tyrosine kinase substrate isoform X8 [Frankliniella occidentalis]|uniref:Hepatocyte growth factor-regulated tyrosine kinase substrate n=1 Tax=Frankliniella occidentalis TaxID=133901 RepID=A0A9C6X3C6_FRAOC|nr:hepatocyte growth factor-regulated tyrosine kinase substrate isoform X6 [Frankliniella occidentalis]XP_052128379.1 hepatocyte growth factor-regulated tyrosine kinase substrate isoform X7 [Frankliniella occidentalis]XP_052128380.1 hepatocyte growth factor-regulated tyrosine kinase substrate isoform X8 [Frankliniella occidentalis]
MFRASAIDKLLDKATDHCQLDPNYSTILQICDTIRQGDCQPKQALAAITKKITHDNPHVANFGLLVLESVVKNCGSPIHNEVGTIHFMEQLRELHKASPHEIVKTKILELLQAWAFAFRNTPKYRAVQDIVTIMKAEGHTFPPLKESDAMFKAETAPEWAEGTVCFKCRQVFSMVTRKHHCRACGQVFCGTCSSKTSLVPKFGIEKEVRVCDQCYQQINSRAAPSATTKVESELPAEYLNSSLAHQSQAAPRRTEDELREEEELQLAIALSQSEAEEKEKLKTKSPHLSSLSSHLSAVKSEPVLHAEQDPEMARYLDRSYWDQKNKEETSKVPSAPSHVNSSPSPQPASSAQSNHQLSNTSAKSNTSATLVSNPTQVDVSLKLQQNGVTEDIEIDDFVSTLRGQVEIFVNRMKSNSSRGRSIANDSSVQTLFMNITAMHSRLLRYIQQQDDSRVHYEGLQDKLAQVKDARAALDALRFEHREKLRQQAEEAEKLRQIQMAQKLDIMRQKKQEYLQYQRQLALQRIQEQEREMQMRQEQQKQQYLMGGVPYNRFMPPGPGGMPPGGVLPGGLPSGLPPYSTGPMYSQQAHPSYLGHQVPFAGHIPQGMMHGSHMGSNQMPSAGAGGPQHGQMSHGGPQPGQLGHGGQQPGQMIGPQHNQMGPGVQHGQMGPGGPHPGQMGPGGPHPGQMGPGGQQPGQMGPGGPQPGQMGPGGPQPGQMGPGGPQTGHMASGRPMVGPQMGQLGPTAPQHAQMVPMGMPQTGQMSGPHMGGMGHVQMQQGHNPEVKRESEELISFD